MVGGRLSSLGRSIGRSMNKCLRVGATPAIMKDILYFGKSVKSFRVNETIEPLDIGCVESATEKISLSDTIFVYRDLQQKQT